MATVTGQPLSYGLEREKHIETLFRAFHRSCRPSTHPEDVAASSGQGRRFFPSPREKAVRLGAGEGGWTTAAIERDGGLNEEELTTEGLPASLNALRTVKQLCITAIPELQGPRCVTYRSYSITTESKEQLLVGVEESSCLCMQCCGPARSCSLQFFDRDRKNTFLFERPLRAETCCLGCCLMETRVFTAQRELLGAIHQRWSLFTPYFEVCDSVGSSSMRIQGCCCPIRCISDQDFQVVSLIGERIGRIWKKWPGYNETCNMDHEHFGLDVPENMSVKSKVLLLAATFLLNHMFFEMS